MPYGLTPPPPPPSSLPPASSSLPPTPSTVPTPLKPASPAGPPPVGLADRLFHPEIDTSAFSRLNNEMMARVIADTRERFDRYNVPYKHERFKARMTRAQMADLYNDMLHLAREYELAQTAAGPP